MGFGEQRQHVNQQIIRYKSICVHGKPRNLVSSPALLPVRESSLGRNVQLQKKIISINQIVIGY
jgi:hypothetical protein